MKKFLLAVMIVVGNLFLMPAVDAEIKTYTGTDEYVVGEHETHEVAKQNSKIRAMRNAQDQAGVFIRSRSRMKDLELVDDEVVTLTEGILKVVGAPNHEIRLLGDGKGVLIVTTIKVEIDTDDLDRRLAEIGKTHSANKPPIDRPKPLENLEKISPPPAVDNIALSQQKSDEGWKLWDKKDFNGAKNLFDEAIRLNSDNAIAWYGRGTAYEDLGQYEQAVQDLNKAIELNPNHANSYNNRGNAYNDLKQYERAIQDYDKAIQLNPNYALAYNNRGTAYDDLGQYERAIQDYEKAIQLNPNYANAYNNRGVAYFNQKQYERAIQDYDKAIQLNPNYAKAYNNRGNAYREMKQYDQAINNYNKALELNLNYSHAYRNRGRTYQHLKNYRKAIEDLSKAIKFDSKYTKAYVNRGQCYEALGEHEKARADFDKARQLGWKG